MKPWSQLLALGLVLVGAGCAAAKRTPTLALSITTSDGSTLSAPERSEVVAHLRPEVARRGYVFADSLRAADYIMYVQVQPDAARPTSGNVSVLSVEPNPMWISNPAAGRHLESQPGVRRATPP